MTIRVGVIGVGGMGACHARHVADLAGARVAWVADPDRRAGESLAAELSTEWVHEAFDRIDDCDALVVACPDRLHHRYLTAGLDRALPILAEKPLTDELADARDVVDRESSLGRRLIQVGFMRVYDERHVQVAESLRQLGEVRHLRAVHRNANDESRSLRRILVESLVHDVHSARWFSGREITSVATAVVEGKDGATRMVIVSCRLEGGAVAVLEFDELAAGYEVSVEITADRGNVVASEPPRPVIRTEGSIGSVIGRDWFVPFLDAYRVEARDFLESVRLGTVGGPSAWDGYAAQVVVEAALQSAALGGARVEVDLPAKPSLYGPDRGPEPA